MDPERDARFRVLMAERDAAYAEYREELRPTTTSLGDQPAVAHLVDWESWERVKNRYDAARERIDRFQRDDDPVSG